MRFGLLIVLIAGLQFLNPLPAHSSPPALQTQVELAQAVGLSSIQALGLPFVRQELITWKVGDRASYVINASAAAVGTMEKTIDRDEGTTVWMKQLTRLNGREHVVEIQFDRQTAEIVKVIHNGQEIRKPAEPEVVSQEVTEVSVPAGRFQAIHLVLKTGAGKLDEWVNPVETVMDGMLKQAVAPLPGVAITVELTAFSAASRH